MLAGCLQISCWTRNSLLGYRMRMASAASAEAFSGRDGRIARGLRTRESILLAYESIIVRATVPPTGAELAARAGVSARSVFTHFGDMDSVHAAAARRAFDWVVETHSEISLDLSLDERLALFSVRQAEILERTAPLYRMFRVIRHGARRRASPPVEEILGGVDQLLRRYVEFVFGRELEGCAGSNREVLMEALVVTSSWNLWEGLRGAQSLSSARASEIMARILASLLH